MLEDKKYKIEIVRLNNPQRNSLKYKHLILYSKNNLNFQFVQNEWRNMNIKIEFVFSGEIFLNEK